MDSIDIWNRDGCVVVRGALPFDLVERARNALDRAYSEPGLTLFECLAEGERYSPLEPRHRSLPAKALDLHWIDPDLRAAAFAPAVVDFLSAVLNAAPKATQSLGFWRGSGQGAHQDSAFVSYDQPERFAAAWIALEDVRPGAGELFYYPGSHALGAPDILGHRNVMQAAERFADHEITDCVTAYVAGLSGRAEAAGFRRERLIIRAGDVLFWSPHLVHGGEPVSADLTRKSLVVHYCAEDVQPLYDVRMERRHDGNAFTTSVYA